MQRTSRADIRTKALRAAAKVALLGAGFGCGVEGTQQLAVADEPDAGAPDPLDQVQADAATPPIDAGVIVVADTGVVIDAGLTLDAGVVRDAATAHDGSVADSGICDISTLSQEEYLECCERLGWDWERGCAAWGPPAPPSLTGGVA